MSASQFVFVGEQPSPRAQALRATWRSGRLAGKTLHRALRAAGIDPALQRYTNLFDDQGRVKRRVLRHLCRLVRDGLVVVGLGRTVCRVLADQGVPHVALVHPPLADTSVVRTVTTLMCERRWGSPGRSQKQCPNPAPTPFQPGGTT